MIAIKDGVDDTANGRHGTGLLMITVFDRRLCADARLGHA